MRKNKLLLGMLSALLCLTISPLSALADEGDDKDDEGKVEYSAITYRSDETGKITINYFDDNTQKVPTVGSTWRIYKVGDVTYTNAEMTVDGLKITSLIDGLDITRETTAEDVQKKIDYKVVTESEITVTGKDTNGKTLKYLDGTTDAKGNLVFDNLEQGVYFGIEVKSPTSHNRSTPFLVSIPNTDETGRISSLEATIEPKAVLAGNLVVNKELHGNAAEIAWQWTMELTLPDGVYHYKTTEMKKYGTTYSKGQEGYCKSGDEIKIYAGETLTIYNLPAGAKYSIHESQENGYGYSTRYDNQSGTLVAYKDVNVTVHNTKNKDVNTATGSDMLVYVGVGAIAAAGLIILFAVKAKEKKEDKKNSK